jgi:PKD repeat protein
MSTRRLLAVMAIGVLAGALMPAVAQDEPSLFADFLALQTSGPLPLEVEFRDLSLGDPTSWRWDFGDDSEISTKQNPIHRYERTGTYTVSLVVRNARGSDTETKYDYIAAGVPAAAFTASPTSGTAPLTVSFYDRSTGNPVTWRWDFGDGAAAYGPSQSHTYHTAGSYTVSLTVSNTVSSDTATASIHVNAPPPSAFP